MDRRPQAREIRRTQIDEKAPAATAAGATGRRQCLPALPQLDGF